MPAPIPHPSALGRGPKRNGARRLRRSQTTERLDVLLDPLFASGSERAEQENRALIANQNVRGIRDKLRRTAHGCVLLSSNTHQVTKTEKAPSYQAQSWRPFALCATSAFRLTTVPSKRRLVALSRCPDADCILPAS